MYNLIIHLICLLIIGYPLTTLMKPNNETEELEFRVFHKDCGEPKSTERGGRFYYWNFTRYELNETANVLNLKIKTK